MFVSYGVVAAHTPRKAEILQDKIMSIDVPETFKFPLCHRTYSFNYSAK